MINSISKLKTVYITIAEKKLMVREQGALKNVNNYLNTNIDSYSETSGGQSSNLYLNVVHSFNNSVK
jgi:hypothetical protein